MGLFDKKKEEGLIESYGIVYLGGHPDYPKKKSGKIELKVFEDRFEFLPTMGTKGWFNGFTIPYNKVLDVQIVQRQVGTVEGILGGLDSRQLNQANNIHISYKSDSDEELLLRFEMLSGVTVMGQAVKCREFEDRLLANQIRKKFRSVAEPPRNQQVNDDIPTQIEKFAALCNKGIISKEEFEATKKNLLSKMLVNVSST